MADELQHKITSATKWSAIGEILAKLVSPISTMILARVLTPEAFGVVATITLITSFADIFMDSGFQRYIIQREYKSESEKYRYADVAFWSNFVFGVIIWGVIFIFNDGLARLVGNPGLGTVIVVASISIPINAITSIQMAIFKHSLDFKSLFFRRIAMIVVPLCVTVPLAFILRSYWALVCGTIASNIITAVILTVFSPWRPSLFYNFGMLRSMLGFSSWSLADAFLVWATSYGEIFVIGVVLNEYYLGLYRTAISTVAQFVSLISAIILPVLMPAFSRCQNDYGKMRDILYKMQKYTALFLIPVGCFIFAYRHQVTRILLGDQWDAIAMFIGIWALSEVVMLLYSRFCSNIFPAINKPNVSVIVQVLHLVLLIPSVYFAATISFEALYWTRTIVRLQLLLLNCWFAYKYINLSLAKSLKETFPYILSGVVMLILSSYFLTLWSSLWSLIIWAPLSIMTYIGLLSLSRPQRMILLKVKEKVTRQISKKLCRQ